MSWPRLDGRHPPLGGGGPASAAPGAPTLSAPPTGDGHEQPGAGVERGHRRDELPGPGVGQRDLHAAPRQPLTTPNTKYGPPADLPLGTLHWRVAAIDGGGQGPFSDRRQLHSERARRARCLASPADGATLDFPTDPPVFSWEPFPGAKRYEIEIDNEPTFTAPLTLGPTTTNNTSYSLTTPPSVGQTFYWRVRAFNSANAPSQYSEDALLLLRLARPSRSSSTRPMTAARRPASKRSSSSGRPPPER